MNISIPTYALYGETDRQDESWLHWETITSRSGLHGFRIEPHRHEHLFQVLYLAKGTADVLIDECARTVSGPALITIPPLVVHSFRFSEDVEGYVLTLFARDVKTVLAEAPEIAEGLSLPRVLAGLENTLMAGEVDNAVRRLIVEADHKAPGQVAALKARLLLLLVIIQRIEIAETEGGDRRTGRAEQLVRDFQTLVDAHFRETRAIAFYAARLGITPTHLNRVCRQVLSATALTLIERRIVLEAKRYLQFSSLSIKEIGIVLGYADPAYFSRFFAQRAGLTPSGFRLQALGSDAAV